MTLYRSSKDKFQANKIAAYTPGVRLELAKTATQIGMTAARLLDARHNQTTNRAHDLPPPRIKVEQGKKLDWFVMLEAEGVVPSSTTGRSKGFGNPGTMRAVGIEFGHHFEPYEANTSGPWNRSNGLHVLRDAVTEIQTMRGGL